MKRRGLSCLTIHFSLLVRLIKLDLILSWRYGLGWVAIIITILYSIVLWLIPDSSKPWLTSLLVFSDPVMLGFLFTGAMILFEKDSGSLNAIILTPVRPWHYILSKSISLSFISLLCSFGIAIAGMGIQFHFLPFLLSVFLSSSLFVFIGIAGVAHVKTFNQYILVIPLFLLPAALPIVDYLTIFSSKFFWILPTMSTLKLFKGSFSILSNSEIYLSCMILIISNLVAFYLAGVQFRKNIIEKY